MSNERPIILVDGMNIFIRHFMANESISAKSEPIGGVYGFIKFLDTILYRWSPQKLIVVWEQGGASPRRKKIFPDYKANRGKLQLKERNDIKSLLKNDVENKVNQLTVLNTLLKQTPVCQIFVKDTECDDIIGYLVKHHFAQTDALKLIMSSDKDFYQLLDQEDVKIYDPAKKITIDKDYVLEKFNIHPRQICLARTIAGDPSDNLDGVPGVGLKTLSKRFTALVEPDKDLNVDDIISECHNILKANKKLQAPKDILSCEALIRRNWKLMYLNSSNLSAHQIEKILGTLELHDPKLKKFELMKEVSKNGLNIPFDFNNFCNLLKQNLLF